MLTDSSQIVYLAAPGQSSVDDAPAPISFAQPSVEDQQVKFATFGTFMAKQGTDNREVTQRSGPLIVGRGAHNAVNAVSFYFRGGKIRDLLGKFLKLLSCVWNL